MRSFRSDRVAFFEERQDCYFAIVERCRMNAIDFVDCMGGRRGS